MANKEKGRFKSILPTKSISDLTQTNSFSQNSHINVKFVNVDSVQKYDDQIKEDQLFKSKNSKNGGVTCCVPLCYSNSKRNPELSYVIPNIQNWKNMVSNAKQYKDFTPTASYRDCSLYLAGEKKTFLNNVPTIVTKTVKPIERTPRRTLNSTGVLKRLLPNVQTPDDLTKSIETEADSNLIQEAILQQQINDLLKQASELNAELSCKNKELLDTKIVMQEQKFCIDRFKHNKTHFKFYTGFESFGIFEAVLDYLNPAEI